MFIGRNAKVPSSPPPQLIQSTPSPSPSSSEDNHGTIDNHIGKENDGTAVGKREPRLLSIGRGRRKSSLRSKREVSSYDNDQDTDPTTATDDSDELNQKPKVVATPKRDGRDSKPRWSPKRLLRRGSKQQLMPKEDDEDEGESPKLDGIRNEESSKALVHSSTQVTIGESSDENENKNKQPQKENEQATCTNPESEKKGPKTLQESSTGSSESLCEVSESKKQSSRWVKAGTVHWIQAGTEQTYNERNRAIAQNQLNGPRSSMETNESKTNKVDESHRVRFSPNVSSVMGQADDYDRTITSENQQEVEEDEFSSGGSLCLGGWIGDIGESETSEGVAVVDMTNESFSEFSSLRVPTLQLTRASTPFAVTKGYATSSTSPCGGRVSPLSLREDEGRYSSTESFSSFLDSVEHMGEGSDPWDETGGLRNDVDGCPMSRRGRVWTRIVDMIRAVIMFAGFSMIASEPPLCGKDVRVFMAIKLAGALLLCCLACWSINGHHGRFGWTKLGEVVISRKTALLLIYLWTWSHLANSVITPFFDVSECTLDERIVFALNPREAVTKEFEGLVARYADRFFADSGLDEKQQDAAASEREDVASVYEMASGSKGDLVVEVVDFVVRTSIEEGTQNHERSEVCLTQDYLLSDMNGGERMDTSPLIHGVVGDRVHADFTADNHKIESPSETETVEGCEEDDKEDMKASVDYIETTKSAEVTFEASPSKSLDTATGESGRIRLNPRSPDDLVDLFGKEKSASSTEIETVGTVVDGDENSFVIQFDGEELDVESDDVRSIGTKDVTLVTEAHSNDLTSIEESSQVNGTVSSGDTKDVATHHEPAKRISNSRFNLPFGAKTKVRNLRKYKCGYSSCDRPPPRLLGMSFSRFHSSLSDSDHSGNWTMRLHSATVEKILSITRGALRHCVAFWLGVEGKWMNQDTLDSLYQVWSNKFWV